MALINVYRNLDLGEREIIDAEAGRPLFKIVEKIDWKNTLVIVNGNNADKDYIVKENDLISVKQYPSNETTSDVLVSIFVPFGFVGVATKHIARAVVKNQLEDALKGVKGSVSNIAQTQQLPSIRGASNQNANGRPVPFVFGKSLFTPYIVGNGYTEISGTDGEEEYYNTMLLLGYNDVTVQDIRMGGLKVASNGNGEIPSDNMVAIDGNFRFTQGGDNATQIELRSDSNEMTLYPQKVAQDNFSEHIIHTPAEGSTPEYILKLDKFSALNPQKIEVEIALDKLLQYDDQNNEQSATVKIGIAISYDDGKTWNAFNQIKQSDSYEIVNMTTVDTSVSGKLGVSTITRKKNKNLRFVATQEMLYNDVINAENKVAIVRVVRYDAETLNTRKQDVCYLSAIRTWCFDRKASLEGGILVSEKPMLPRLKNKVTRMALRIKATDFIQGSLDKITCILTSKCKTWNGTEWSIAKTPTENPASNIVNYVTHPMLGSNSYEGKFVLDKLGELYEWCEEKNIKVDGVLIQQKKIEDVLNLILTNCRSSLILDGNKYSVWIDKPQTVPVTVLNNHNILPQGLSNRKDFSKLPDAFSVKFVDALNEYTEGQFYVNFTNTDLSLPTTVIQSIDLTWITNYEQAYRQALYLYAQLKLRPETWTRRQGIEGNIVEIGDLIEVQDDTISVGIGDGGEIVDVEVGNGHIVSITTDARFNIADLSQEYAVTLNTASGTRTDIVVFNSVEFTNKLYFATPVSLDDLIQYHIGDIISFGIYQKVTTQALVLGKKSNPDQTFDLTLVPYQDGVYTADEGVIPEYDPKATTPQPIVSTPIIPQDFSKIPIGRDGKDGKDGKDGVGLTVFLEKSALVYDADNVGNVIEQSIRDRVRIEQAGIPVPFSIGQIISPSGFEVTSLGTFVIVKALTGNKMAKNGVIRIPINYSPVLEAYNYVDENGNFYTDENGDIYTYVESSPEVKNFDLYISYAKAEKGKRAPEYVGVLTGNPTGVFQEGDYYINKNDARIYRYKKVKPIQLRMLRASPRLKNAPISRSNGLEWTVVDSDTEPSLYYEKINELTSVMGGLPEDDKTVKFVNGYFDLLFANTGYIRKLFSERITLSQDGLIQSENFSPDVSGTLIKANGETEINNLKARGDISAKNIFIENMGIRINAGDFFVGRYNATYQYKQVFLQGIQIFYFNSKWGNNFYSPASGSFKIKIGMNNKTNINTITYDLFKKNKDTEKVLVDSITITKDTPIGDIKEELLPIDYGDTLIWEYRGLTLINNNAETTYSNLYIDFFIENENYTINALCGGFSYNMLEIYPTK